MKIKTKLFIVASLLTNTYLARADAHPCPPTSRYVDRHDRDNYCDSRDEVAKQHLRDREARIAAEAEQRAASQCKSYESSCVERFNWGTETFWAPNTLHIRYQARFYCY